MVEYKTFVDIYRKAHPSMKKELQFKEAQKLWNEVKKDPEKLGQVVMELKTKASKFEAKSLTTWLGYGAKSKTKVSEEKVSQENKPEKKVRIVSYIIYIIDYKL